MEYIKGNLVNATPLVTTAEVITALRLDVYDTDEITRLIKSAQEAVEDYCNLDFYLKNTPFLPMKYLQHLLAKKYRLKA